MARHAAPLPEPRTSQQHSPSFEISEPEPQKLTRRQLREARDKLRQQAEPQQNAQTLQQPPNDPQAPKENQPHQQKHSEPDTVEQPATLPIAEPLTLSNTPSTLLFSALSPALPTPLHQQTVSPEPSDATEQDATPASAEPPRSLKQKIFATSALLGCAGLALTFMLPGVQTIAVDPLAQNAASQQSIHTRDGGSESESFDALNVVTVEPGDSAGSFVNYQDAAVQYPFANTVQLTDPFGERAFPVAGFHDAQDFAAAAGTPVQAIADGTVIAAGIETDGCGFGLTLVHEIDGAEVTSRYCHMQMNSHDLSVGDKVSVGDPAGRVGNTGLSFGPHLHFVITIDGEAVDPMPFLLKYNRETRVKR